MNESLEILYEDEDLLVVNKPPGLVCHPTKPDGRSSLIACLRAHLGPGATPSMVNRLDRETSGLVLVAKTRAAASELGRLTEQRAVEKAYLGIVHGHPAQDQGRIEAPLGRDPDALVAIQDTVRPDGAPAITEFHVLCRFVRPVPDRPDPRWWKDSEPAQEVGGANPAAPDGRSACCASGLAPAANTSSASIWLTWATRSWATNSTGAIRPSTSISSWAD